jgi:hypothetical protein
VFVRKCIKLLCFKRPEIWLVRTIACLSITFALSGLTCGDVCGVLVNFQKRAENDGTVLRADTFRVAPLASHESKLQKRKLKLQKRLVPQYLPHVSWLLSLSTDTAHELQVSLRQLAFYSSYFFTDEGDCSQRNLITCSDNQITRSRVFDNLGDAREIICRQKMCDRRR